MNESARMCQATTRLGAPCKNKALAGSKYCAAHRQLNASPAPMEAPLEAPAGDAPVVATPVPAATIAAVNQVAAELHQTSPTYQPPPYSPQALLALLQQNAERLADKTPVLGELWRNLEGTKPEDLVDPETWKGLWYILNYTAQAQTKQAVDAVVERLAKLPGGDALLLVKSTIESASPKDLLDLNTWKGALIIVTAAVQAQASEVKRRVLGQQDE